MPIVVYLGQERKHFNFNSWNCKDIHRELFTIKKFFRAIIEFCLYVVFFLVVYKLSSQETIYHMNVWRRKTYSEILYWG